MMVWRRNVQLVAMACMLALATVALSVGSSVASAPTSASQESWQAAAAAAAAATTKTPSATVPQGKQSFQLRGVAAAAAAREHGVQLEDSVEQQSGRRLEAGSDSYNSGATFGSVIVGLTLTVAALCSLVLLAGGASLDPLQQFMALIHQHQHVAVVALLVPATQATALASGFSSAFLWTVLGFKLRNIESLAVGWADALRAPVDDAHDGDSHLQHRGVADVGVPIQRLAAAAQVDIAPFLHYVVLVTLLGLVAVAAVHVVIYIVAACCKQLHSRFAQRALASCKAGYIRVWQVTLLANCLGCIGELTEADDPGSFTLAMVWLVLFCFCGARFLWARMRRKGRGSTKWHFVKCCCLGLCRSMRAGRAASDTRPLTNPTADGAAPAAGAAPGAATGAGAGAGAGVAAGVGAGTGAGTGSGTGGGAAGQTSNKNTRGGKPPRSLGTGTARSSMSLLNTGSLAAKSARKAAGAIVTQEGPTHAAGSPASSSASLSSSSRGRGRRLPEAERREIMQRLTKSRKLRRQRQKRTYRLVFAALYARYTPEYGYWWITDTVFHFFLASVLAAVQHEVSAAIVLLLVMVVIAVVLLRARPMMFGLDGSVVCASSVLMAVQYALLAIMYAAPASQQALSVILVVLQPIAPMATMAVALRRVWKVALLPRLRGPKAAPPSSASKARGGASGGKGASHAGAKSATASKKSEVPMVLNPVGGAVHYVADSR